MNSTNAEMLQELLVRVLVIILSKLGENARIGIASSTETLWFLCAILNSTEQYVASFLCYSQETAGVPPE